MTPTVEQIERWVKRATKAQEDCQQIIDVAGFKKDDHVFMTEAALKNRLDGPQHRRTGIVRGFSRDRRFLRVQRNGAKSVEVYHPKFWQVHQ